MQDLLFRSLVMGVAATALLDLWALLLNRLFGFGLPNWGLVGRWFGHMPQGRFIHESIADSRAIRGERVIGWASHYLIGVIFALATLLLAGPGFRTQPTLFAPMSVGLATVACGWFLLSPGMGGGMAHARKPDAGRIRLLNVIGHTVFGLGLYGAALLLK